MLRPDHRRHRIEIDPAIGGQRHDVDRDADPLGDQLPRHDVAVMLQHRQQDAVASLQVALGPALRDQIDPLGRATHEHAFLGRARADERRDPATGGLIGERHVGRALVHTAMHRGIGRVVRAGDRVDHALRFLRGRGGVQIRPSGGDRGKVADAVEGGSVSQSAASSHASASAANASRTVSSPIRSSESATNALVSSALARASFTPRLRR